MKLMLLVISSMFIFLSSAQAGQCFKSFKQAKEYESILEDVYYVSEADDEWHSFASWSKVRSFTKRDVRRALRLGKTFEGEPSYFLLEGAKEAYRFLEWQVTVHQPENYDDPAAMIKFRKVITDIKKRYGNNIRLIRFGNGDKDGGYFSGYLMVVALEENGCLLGIKAYTVWS